MSTENLSSILVIFLLLLDSACTVKIDERLKSEISKKVKAAKTLGSKSVDDILSPQVLIWDPLTQLPWLFPEGIKCPWCQEQLIVSKYMDGQCESRQPILIHGKSSNILLISRILRCQHAHRSLSHSQYVLDMMPSVAVPFILSHKVGFERSLAYELYDMISSGMEINECVRLLKTCRNTNFNVIVEMLNLHPDKQRMIKSNVVDNIKEMMTPVPGRKMIRRCFECIFHEKKKCLEDSIKGTTTSDWLSIDHTFKSVKHIKVNMNGKYLTQIKTLCTVTNDIGQVLTWQLCKSTTFKEIKPALEKLKERFCKQKVELKEVYLDQCCAWRKLVQEVFGEDIVVKLDLFHAAQRVTKFVTKHHPLSKHLLRELKMVFRDHGDIGKKRQKETPPPHHIAHKMKVFDRKWRQSRLQHKGKTVYPKPAQKEVKKLLKHIEKGCVSGIKPGKGTIRNEALHRKLNKRMNKNRISPTFAIALMFTIIHSINSHLARSYKRQLCHVDSEEEFGLPSQSDRKRDEVNMETDDVSQDIVNCRFAIWKLMKNSVASIDPNLACDNGMELLYHIFQSSEDEVSDESHLDENLAALNLIRVPSKADGSCLFMSTSLQLIQLLTDEDIGTKIFSHLSMLFPDLFRVGQPLCDQDTLAIRLRAAMVDEWLNNEDVYKGFVPDVNFQTEALQYLRRDVFEGDMGDMMVLALSNVLNIAIILITPDQDIPLVPVFPSNVLDQRACMYLAFDKNRMHFDSTTTSTIMISEPAPSITPPLPMSSSCSCGVNDKVPTKRCSENTKTGQYKSRCPCSRQHQPCGVLCRCKGCQNSYGQRNDTASRLQGATLRRAKRQRTKEWMDSKPVTSRAYMQEKGHILKAFSKKDDIHLKSQASSHAYLRKRFTEEQIKRRQKTLAKREKYAKYAVKLNRKGPPKRTLVQQHSEAKNSEERKCTKNETWEAGIYSAEQVIDQRLENGSKEYLVKWSGSDICTWEPAENIYDQRLITAFEHSQGAVNGNNTSTKRRNKKKKTLG